MKQFNNIQNLILANTLVFAYGKKNIDLCVSLHFKHVSSIRDHFYIGGHFEEFEVENNQSEVSRGLDQNLY